MSAEILRVHPDEPQPDRIDYIVSCLRKGGVVALPTDTFYGLAVDPVNLFAVEQIYQIKTRQKHKPLSLLISGLSQAYELARDTDPLLDKLADRFWPGPLTIIVRAGTKLPLRSTANTGNVALRVPDAAIPRAVVSASACPSRPPRPICKARQSVPTLPASATRSATAFRSSSTAAQPAARSPPPSSISRSAPAAGRFCARARSLPTKSSWSCSGKMDRMTRDAKPRHRKWLLRTVLLLVVLLTLGALGWCRWVYMQIESYAGQDQAAPADAIGVLGAAEYDGRPSPVYRARLDHALVLYHRGIAPLIITLGGPGGDQYTEGSVGAAIPDQQGRSGAGHHCGNRKPQH